jgi:hypothetical protein
MSSVGHVIGALFGGGTWGAGGNLVAAAMLGVPAYLARNRVGRWLAGHVARHLLARPAGFIESEAKVTRAEFDRFVDRWEAAHSGVQVHTLQTPAPPASVAADGPTAPSVGQAPAAAAQAPAPAAASGPPSPPRRKPEPAPNRRKEGT